MKKLTFIAFLIIVSALAASAQTSDETMIRKFIADYDRAYLAHDISFLEKNFVPEYSFTNEDVRKNFKQAIEEAREEKANPTEKVIDFKSTVDDVRVIGSNTAIASGSWSWTGSLMSENAVTHKDTGRFTLVFEKRDGRWMLAAEHFSDMPHDLKPMEEQVLKLGKLYGEMIKRGDAEEIGKILADDYFYTDESGKFMSRAEDLATYKNRKTRIETVEITDQKVRFAGNNTAIETGNFRVAGANLADNKPFDDTYRYTTVWLFRSLRWQIVSDHTSRIGK